MKKTDMGYFSSLSKKRKFISLTLVVFVILILYAVFHESPDRHQIKSTNDVQKIETRPIGVAKFGDRSQPLIIRKKIISFSKRQPQKAEKPQILIVRKKIFPSTASDLEKTAPYSETKDLPGSVAKAGKEEAIAPKNEEIMFPNIMAKTEKTKLSPALESNNHIFEAGDTEATKQQIAQRAESENITAKIQTSDKVTKRKTHLADAKIDDSLAIFTIEKESGAFKKASLHPYSVMLSSCRLWESVSKLLSDYQERNLSPYFVKVDRGESGIWWRILLGHYKTREEALRIREKNNLSESLVVKMPYANLIDIFSSETEAMAIMEHLEKLRYSPYIIQHDRSTFQLLVGAFITKKGAEKQKIELLSIGIPNKVIER
ncbi:MAG: SPOR domain-containing protein [Desulfobacterales bacterium]|nr:MAG: SPOR domain-containing protein [Desulfobacterales bacterium]